MLEHHCFQAFVFRFQIRLQKHDLQVIKTHTAQIKGNIVFSSLINVILRTKVRQFRASLTFLDNGSLLGHGAQHSVSPASLVVPAGAVPIDKTCCPGLCYVPEGHSIHRSSQSIDRPLCATAEIAARPVQQKHDIVIQRKVRVFCSTFQSTIFHL